MCQLTYTNLKSPFLNSLMIYLLSTYGSKEKHDDGCGIMCSDDSIWKSHSAAHRISNLGEILSSCIKDDKPQPFHIRQATYGIEVSKENSHPFQGKHYILMHNGTLIPRNGEEPKDKKKDSDSARFLAFLDESKDLNPKEKFINIFNKAMDEFSGKFAFIIRDKSNGYNYIIRGKTAELWISKLSIAGEYVGYVINTSKDTMKDAFYDFINIAGLSDGNEYKFSEPTLLKHETIYHAKDNDIKEIGTTKENIPIKKEIVPVIIPPMLQSPSKSRKVDNHHTLSGDLGKLVDKSARIYEFLDDHSLNLLDLQIIMKVVLGISNLEITMDDLEMFTTHLINKLSATKAMRKQVKSILRGNTFPMELYFAGNLEYPWMVNSNDKIIKALKPYAS